MMSSKKINKTMKTGKLCNIMLRRLGGNVVDKSLEYFQPFLDEILDKVCHYLEGEEQTNILIGPYWPSASKSDSIRRYVEEQLGKSLRNGLYRWETTASGIKLKLEQLCSPEVRAELDTILQNLMDRDTEAGRTPEDNHLSAAVVQPPNVTAEGGRRRLQLCYERLTDWQAGRIWLQYRLRRPDSFVDVEVNKTKAPFSENLYEQRFNFAVKLLGDEGRAYNIYIAIFIRPPGMRSLEQNLNFYFADKLIRKRRNRKSSVDIIEEIMNSTDDTEDLTDDKEAMNKRLVQHIAKRFGVPKVIAESICAEFLSLHKKYKATITFCRK